MKRILLWLSLFLPPASMAIAPIISLAQVPPVKGVKPGVVGAITLNNEGTYCHLRYPAIRPSTLDSKNPELKSPSSGDIVDFYGPCDHDPVGPEEVQTQKRRAEGSRTGRK